MNLFQTNTNMEGGSGFHGGDGGEGFHGGDGGNIKIKYTHINEPLWNFCKIVGTPACPFALTIGLVLKLLTPFLKLIKL